MSEISSVQSRHQAFLSNDLIRLKGINGGVLTRDQKTQLIERGATQQTLDSIENCRGRLLGGMFSFEKGENKPLQLSVPDELVRNKPAKYPTDKGLKQMGENYVLASNPQGLFKATMNKTQQLVWKSATPVSAKDVSEVAKIALKYGDSVLINTGTHGDPEGNSAAQKGSYAESRFFQEDLSAFRDRKNVVAVHIVSSHSPAIYPRNADQIIDAWCFSEKKPKSAEIFRACTTGALATIKQEVEKLSDPEQKKIYINQMEKDGDTPLLIATRSGHSHIATYLLELGAKIDCKDPEGYTPLHWAAKNGHLDTAKVLVEKGKADVNQIQSSEFGRTPLHMAAHNGKKEIAQYLISQGADINIQSGEADFCLTPLHSAVSQDCFEIIRILTQSGDLNVNLRDKRGRTPLWYALMGETVDIATLIFIHKSFAKVQDSNDPNHPEELLKALKPRKGSQTTEFIQKRLMQ